MFDLQAIRNSFGRAHRSYDAVALLQREVEDTLFEQLEFLKRVPDRILDLGCGPGRGAAMLRKRFPKAELIALDQALPMLARARQQFTWRRRFERVCARAEALPLPAQCVDLVWSSLCVQWCQDLPRVLSEIRRVLRPGGLVLLSTLGPDSLHELRAAWAAVDDLPHVHGFTDLQYLGGCLQRAGFRDPVLERDLLMRHYPDALSLMRELKQLGAHNADHARSRGLYGRKALAQVQQAYEQVRTPNGLPCTWELHYAMGFGPEDGQPVRIDGMEVAHFSLDSLRRRRS